MKTLSKEQLERQDFVDNEIFVLLQKLLPSTKQMGWNIEIIGAVRDAIQYQVTKKKFMNKRQFYPYIKI